MITPYRVDIALYALIAALGAMSAAPHILSTDGREWCGVALAGLTVVKAKRSPNKEQTDTR